MGTSQNADTEGATAESKTVSSTSVCDKNAGFPSHKPSSQIPNDVLVFMVLQHLKAFPSSLCPRINSLSSRNLLIKFAATIEKHMVILVSVEITFKHFY